MKKELKHCPFCGENEDVVVRNRTDQNYPNIGKKYSFVECLPCDARTGRFYDEDAILEGFADGEQAAIFHWNMRDGKID